MFGPKPPSETHYTCIFDGEERIIHRASDVKPLATHYICVGTVAGTMSCSAFVGPRRFGRGPPPSPHPRKRASERAGTATGLAIQSGQRFSLVMFAFMRTIWDGL